MPALEVLQRTGPHVVVLGECAAREDLAVTAEPEIVARVTVGQEVEFVYRYAFQETAEARDFFRVALVSRVGGTSPPPRLHQTLNRKGIRDDLRGFLVHRYAFRAAGVYEGSFALMGEVLSQSRSTGEVVHWRTLTRQGAVRLHVTEAPPGAPPSF